MSLNLHSLIVVNTSSTTISPQNDVDNKSNLTPGQIALITIGTSYVFFISIMLIICFGEFVQYNKRKTGKGIGARKKISMAEGSYNYDSEVRSGSQFESSQSDYTSAFQARQSMSVEPIPSTSKMKDHTRHISDSNIPMLPRHSISTSGVETLTHNTSHSTAQIDCDMTCESVNNDIGMIPLIGKQCDEMVDIDGEILCDSTESRDVFSLEADV
ncbi:hypothetical protein ACF0H5_008184 [Mactra antiquata]